MSPLWIQLITKAIGEFDKDLGINIILLTSSVIFLLTCFDRLRDPKGIMCYEIFYLQPLDGQLWFDVARWVLILNQLGCACVWERALVSFVNLYRFLFFHLSFLMNFNSICWCKVEYYWVCKLPCESLQVPTKPNLFWIIVTAE